MGSFHIFLYSDIEKVYFLTIKSYGKVLFSFNKNYGKVLSDWGQWQSIHVANRDKENENSAWISKVITLYDLMK